MFADVDDDIEVAVRAAAETRLALGAKLACPDAEVWPLGRARSALDPYADLPQEHRLGDDRRLDLPLLPEGEAFQAARAWFDLLEAKAGERRILICIDEFEELEKRFRGDRKELLELMALFRATILFGGVGAGGVTTGDLPRLVSITHITETTK